MTAVEFYDRTPIENAISSLTTAPDKIIFIGDGNRAKKFLDKMNLFLEKKGLSSKIKIDIRKIKRNNLNDIVEVLTDIVNTEEDCVFDLTGGDDLVLVAMGIVYQKFAHKNIKIQRFNINNAEVTDCDNDGCVIYKGKPEITVEQNVILHGGAVKYDQNPRKGTYKYDYTDEFISDVNEMWKICATDPGFWNTRVNILAQIEEYYGDDGLLSVSFNINALKARLVNDNIKYVKLDGLLRRLNAKNLISYVVCNNEDYTITYKNQQIKFCLGAAGTVLEQKVTVTAREIMLEEGIYNDVMSGVHIDWDGKIGDNSNDDNDTKNEIDVIAMHGVVPLFISCKNGRVDDDELYKLETVANRFGGIYSKKFLIATYLNKGPKSLAAFMQRAEDMKIFLINDVHRLSEEKFKRTIKNLISRQ